MLADFIYTYDRGTQGGKCGQHCARPTRRRLARQLREQHGLGGGQPPRQQERDEAQRVGDAERHGRQVQLEAPDAADARVDDDVRLADDPVERVELDGRRRLGCGLARRQRCGADGPRRHERLVVADHAVGVGGQPGVEQQRAPAALVVHDDEAVDDVDGDAAADVEQQDVAEPDGAVVARVDVYLDLQLTTPFTVSRPRAQILRTESSLLLRARQEQNWLFGGVRSSSVVSTIWATYSYWLGW